MLGVGVAEELVETLVDRMNRLLFARPRLAVMPLAEEGRAVAQRLERLGDRHFVRQGKSSSLGRTPEWIVDFPVRNAARLGAQTTAAV